jgi:predicted oxidoreductase
MAYAPDWVPSCTRTNESHKGESAEEQYDVIVVGAGWAGIGAAIGAKRAAPSVRVLVLESESCLGGASTHRGVLALCGLYTCDGLQKKAVVGVWDELHGKLLARRVVSKEPVSHRGTFW